MSAPRPAAAETLVLLNFASVRRRVAAAATSGPARILVGSAKQAGEALPAGPLELGPCEVVVAEILG